LAVEKKESIHGRPKKREKMRHNRPVWRERDLSCPVFPFITRPKKKKRKKQVEDRVKKKRRDVSAQKREREHKNHFSGMGKRGKRGEAPYS